MLLHCPGHIMFVFNYHAMSFLSYPILCLFRYGSAFSGSAFQFVLICPALFHVLSMSFLALHAITCHHCCTKFLIQEAAMHQRSLSAAVSGESAGQVRSGQSQSVSGSAIARSSFSSFCLSLKPQPFRPVTLRKFSTQHEIDQFSFYCVHTNIITTYHLRKS